MGPGQVGAGPAPVMAPTSQCFTFPLLVKCSFYYMSMREILFSSHDLLEVVKGVHESEHSIKINYSPVLLLSFFFV